MLKRVRMLTCSSSMHLLLIPVAKAREKTCEQWVSIRGYGEAGGGAIRLLGPPGTPKVGQAPCRAIQRLQYIAGVQILVHQPLSMDPVQGRRHHVHLSGYHQSIQPASRSACWDRCNDTAAKH